MDFPGGAQREHLKLKHATSVTADEQPFKSPLILTRLNRGGLWGSEGVRASPTGPHIFPFTSFSPTLRNHSFLSWGLFADDLVEEHVR